VHTVTTSLLPGSVENIFVLVCPNDLPYILENGVTVDGSQTQVVDSFTNANGCDSLRIYDISYAQEYDISPDNLIVNFGDSVPFVINNFSDDILMSFTSNTGADCGPPCDQYILFPTDTVNTYYFSIVDTVTGCVFTDILTVELNLYSELNVPNTFTPNGDGINDVFLAYGKNVERFSMQIFDRWGGQMFMSDALDKGWDGLFLGLPVESGIYTLMLEATGLDGQEYKIIQHIKLVR
jgi:gliding motility-associated-like protein